MPRVSCPKCQKAELVLKSGIVRNKQRFVCKRCNYHFTLHHEKKRLGYPKSDPNRATSLADIA
jgi:transposase-like protein